MRLNIKTKLVLGFTLVLTMLAASALISISKLSATNESLSTIVDSHAAKVRLAGETKEQFLKLIRAEKNMILANTTEQISAQASQADESERSVNGKLEKLVTLADATGKATLKEFDEQWRQFADTHKKVGQMALLNSNVHAQAISKTEGRPLLDAPTLILADIEASFLSRAKEFPLPPKPP